jgi:hypothetical protein
MGSGKVTAKHPDREDERDTRRTAALRAQRVFAPSLNAVTWALLQAPDRTDADNEKMLYAAFASAFHYYEVGNPEHHQRAEWLISRVYCVLGNAGEAVRHAKRCLELTEQHDPHLDDYDIAFAYEAMARANALAGNADVAKQFHARAAQGAKVIEDPGHRKVFDDEFKSGNWHGIA